MRLSARGSSYLFSDSEHEMTLDQVHRLLDLVVDTSSTACCIIAEKGVS